MKDNEENKLSRIIKIFTYLQSKKIITGPFLAEKFNVSLRTIYRDIRTLEQAGIPIQTEEGKGYSIMEGYRIPPIMFTEEEANALITAEQFVLKNTDTSLIKRYTEAVSKVKAVLQNVKKEKIDFLSERIAVKPKIEHEYRTNTLTIFQNALIDFRLLEITYLSNYRNEKTQRRIEPFALYNNLHESWTLIAYCRLRKDFRLFRLERILSIEMLDEHFTPHKMTLEQFIEDYKKKRATDEGRQNL